MSRSFLGRALRSWGFSSHGRRSLKQKTAFRPGVEALETRATPSARVPRPIANDDTTDTDGSNPVTIAVLANDTALLPSQGFHNDVLKPITLNITNGPHHGTLSVNHRTGEVTYTAFAGFTGTDTFQYTVRDSRHLRSNAATVSIQVNRPTAADDWIDTDGTNPVTIDVLANDTDPDGNQHIDYPGSVTLLSGPSFGTVTLDPSTNTFTYTATGNFMGTDSFQYLVTDDAGAVSAVPGTVYVRVNRPTATNDLASFSGTTPVVIDVLANDTDPDGNQHIVPSSVTITANPQNGSVSVNPSTGEVTYTAVPGFNGTDTFQYTITDDAGAVSSPGTVTVVGTTSTGMNDDYTDTDGTNPVTVYVLANDNVPGLEPSSVRLATEPANGTATVDKTTGAITYTANANFAGSDTFSYSVRDSAGNLYTANLTVRVNRPVAADDWVDTDGTNPVSINVLANDTDPDGNQHIQYPGSVTQISNPAHGTVTLDPSTNTFTYTASGTFTGTDTFQYIVTDDAGAASLPATVSVRVNRPVATNDAATAHGTEPVTINVLANDSDPDGNQHINYPGSVTQLSSPQHGTVSFNAATNSFTYTAFPGFSGMDSFQYFVTDDAGAASMPATVSINVEVPTVVGTTVTVTAPSTTINVLGLTSDPEGPSALAGFTVVGEPQHGTLTVNTANWTVTYTPAAGYRGSDAFELTVTDIYGVTSNVATINLTVTASATGTGIAGLSK
jgi:hypothetical protein